MSKNNDKKTSSKSNKVYQIIIVCLIVLLGVLVFGVKTGRIDLNSKNIITDKNNIELKHTKASTVKSGVYITDVSEVVEEVMPSIVSKPL